MVFHLGPLAPRPGARPRGHRAAAAGDPATRPHAGAAAVDGEPVRDRRRVAVTGIGVVAPGGIGAKAFWDLLTDGPHRDPRRSRLFDPTAFRSRVAAECDFDPAAARPDARRRSAGWTGPPSSPWSRAREARGRQRPRPRRRCDPTGIGVSLGSAVGCTMSLEQEYVRASATAAGAGWSTTRYAGAAPVRLLRAQLARRRGGLDGRRARARSRWSPPAAPPASTRSGTPPQLIRGGPRRRGASPAPPTRRSRRSPWPASTPSRRPRPATTTRSTPPGRSTPTATGSCSARARPCSSWRSCEHARAPRRARSTPRSPASPRRSNAYHMTGLRPDGREMAEAIRARARRGPAATPTTIDYINAHGSGTKQNDRHETAAFKRQPGRARLRDAGQLDQVDGRPLARRDRLDRDRRLRAGHRAPAWCRRRRTCTTPDPECDLDYVPLHRPRAAARRGAHRRQRVRRVPERDGAAPARKEHDGDDAPSVVVTGIGVVAPNGLGAEDVLDGHPGRAAAASAAITRFDPARLPAAGWPARSAASTPPTHLPSRLLAADRPHDPARAGRRRLGAAPTPASTRRTLPEYDMGVVTASSSGGFEFGQRELREAVAQGRRATSARTSRSPGSTRSTPARSPSGTACAGPCGVVVTEQAGGLDALGQARRQIRTGTRAGRHRRRSTRRCARGAGSAQLATGRLSTGDDPAARLPAVRRATRAGYVPGEGGAILVVEDAEARPGAAARRSRTARSPATRATFDPPPGSRPASPGCAGRSSWRWPTPACAPDDDRRGLRRRRRRARARPRRGARRSRAVFGAARRAGHRAEDA